MKFEDLNQQQKVLVDYLQDVWASMIVDTGEDLLQSLKKAMNIQQEFKKEFGFEGYGDFLILDSDQIDSDIKKDNQCGFGYKDICSDSTGMFFDNEDYDEHVFFDVIDSMLSIVLKKGNDPKLLDIINNLGHSLKLNWTWDEDEYDYINDFLKQFDY